MYYLVGVGQGVWKAVFDPVADIQHVYTVTAALKSQNQIVLSNVLFGDVWVCSGQSNMKLPVEQVLYICCQNCCQEIYSFIISVCICKREVQ